MRSDEFVKEALSSGVAPENFQDIYHNFQIFQNLAIETLKKFHYVCVQSNITYVLAYGSLLGAIRDNGQIPWDYDVDVFVPFEERLKLVDALKKYLDTNFYFYCPEINNKCRHEFIRITPKGYRSEELHVDVFFLTGAPEDYNSIKTTAEQITKLASLRYYKLVNPKYASYGRVRTYIRLLLIKARYFFKSTQKAHEEYLLICKKLKAKDSKYNITTDSFSWKRIYESKDIWNSVLVKMDIGEFYIPLNYDVILKQTYNDYNNFPSLEKRIKEVLSHHERLSKFARYGRRA